MHIIFHTLTLVAGPNSKGGLCRAWNTPTGTDETLAVMQLLKWLGSATVAKQSSEFKSTRRSIESSSWLSVGKRNNKNTIMHDIIFSGRICLVLVSTPQPLPDHPVTDRLLPCTDSRWGMMLKATLQVSLFMFSQSTFNYIQSGL